jgi:hypothetical protein
LYAYQRCSGGMDAITRRQSCYFPAFDRRIGAHKGGMSTETPQLRHSRSGVPGRDGSGRPEVLHRYGVAPDFRAGLASRPARRGRDRRLQARDHVSRRRDEHGGAIAQAWHQTGCPLLVSKPLLHRPRCRPTLSPSALAPNSCVARRSAWSCSRSSASGSFASQAH